MNRWLALFAIGLTANAIRADIGPPIPVVVIPQSALKALAANEQDDDSDPRKTAERIAENTKKAGDRLAVNDSGTDTQDLQNKILRDIDKLLNQKPPMSNSGGGGGGGGSPPPPMGGGQPPPPMGGGQPPPMGGQGQSQPMGGQQQPMGGQPRPMGGQGQPQPMGGQQQPMGGQGQSQPMGGQQPMQPAGGNQPGLAGSVPIQTPPPFVLDDRVTKEVWGHLPTQLRQKMSQYYQEQFMPRYQSLLKQYYSELAEREKERKK